MAMESFDFRPSTRVLFGKGSLAQLGELAGELAGKRILIVTDPGIVAAGIVDRAVASLMAKSPDVSVFDGTGENPTTEHVDAGAAFAKG